MPAVFSGNSTPCSDFDNNASVLNSALLDAQVLTNGTLTLTRIDNSTFTHSIPFSPDYVISGLALSVEAPPTGTTIDYTAGTYQIGGISTYTIASGGTITVNNGHATLDRIDIIYLTTSNTIVYLAGTAATNPVPPTAPANTLVIAEVAVPATSAPANSLVTLQTVNFLNRNNVYNGAISSQTLYWDQSIARWRPNSFLRNNLASIFIADPSILFASPSVLNINGDVQLKPMTAPVTTTDKIYNVGGNLFWDGQQLNTASALSAGTVTNSTLNWNGVNWIENIALKSNDSGLLSYIFTSGTDNVNFNIAATGGTNTTTLTHTKGNNTSTMQIAANNASTINQCILQTNNSVTTNQAQFILQNSTVANESYSLWRVRKTSNSTNFFIELDGTTASRYVRILAQDTNSTSMLLKGDKVTIQANDDDFVLKKTNTSYTTTNTNKNNVAIVGRNVTLSTTSSNSAAIAIDTVTVNQANTLFTQRLRLKGGMQIAWTTVTANYLAALDDYAIAVDCSGGIVTVTLPATPILGQTYHIKDSTGSAFTNNITISGNGTNIDGFATKTINVNWDSFMISYNGNQWSVI